MLLKKFENDYFVLFDFFLSERPLNMIAKNILYFRTDQKVILFQVFGRKLIVFRSIYIIWISIMPLWFDKNGYKKSKYFMIRKSWYSLTFYCMTIKNKSNTHVDHTKYRHTMTKNISTNWSCSLGWVKTSF